MEPVFFFELAEEFASSNLKLRGNESGLLIPGALPSRRETDSLIEAPIFGDTVAELTEPDLFFEVLGEESLGGNERVVSSAIACMTSICS